MKRYVIMPMRLDVISPDSIDQAISTIRQHLLDCWHDLIQRKIYGI